MTEDEMIGWHQQLNGHEFEQAQGVGDRWRIWCAAVHGIAVRYDCVTELNSSQQIQKYHLMQFTIHL